MNKVTTSLDTMGPHQRILDIPAGHGQFADELRRRGHEVVPVDVQKRKSDFVCANMNSPLPFQTDEFDVVTCLEGIEHVINPINLLSELIRVTRPKGRVYISTPNIMNFYSRLQFLMTGTFHGFCPAELHEPDSQNPDGDLGHISPLTYTQIRYSAKWFGADVYDVFSDRYKRKILMPVYAALYLLGRPWSWLLFHSSRSKYWPERNQKIHHRINSAPLLFGRSVIIVLEKHAARS